MPVLTAPAASPPPAPRPRISVERYERMIALGELGPGERVELLDGEIVGKMAIGERHAWCVDLLSMVFHALLPGRAVVRVQNPLQLPGSVPEPDLALVKLPLDRYRTRNPQAGTDLFLLIEVADTSLFRDREEKSPLYAAAGVPEYWVVDLPGGCVWVHSGPQADGTWTTVEAKRPGDALAPAAFPDAAVDLAALLA